MRLAWCKGWAVIARGKALCLPCATSPAKTGAVTIKAQSGAFKRNTPYQGCGVIPPGVNARAGGGAG